MADNAILFKFVAKTIGMKYGIMPTFMAKPYSDVRPRPRPTSYPRAAADIDLSDARMFGVRRLSDQSLQ